MNEVATTISPPAIVMAVSLACCAVAAALGFVNLRRYRRFNLNERSDSFDSNEVPHISVCIPARNEELNIEACVRSVLANRGVNVEVLVYDDDSTDGTPRILAAITAQDGRVRRVDTQTLPMDWNGKQWGCERMGQASQGEWLLFTDADVRLSTDCLRTTWIAANASKCDLISTVPRQIIGTWMEDAIIPLIHFVLLSYLPMGQMRTTTLPAASAGCGQFLFVRKSMWIRSGGHAAFRQSMHDGIKLPRAVRSVGGRTDLFDGTQLAECRMYRTAGQVWRGFAKNAYEGLGSFALLLFITVIHIVGHVLPWGWIFWALFTDQIATAATVLAIAAIAIATLQRMIFAKRFQHSWRTVLLHPLGILLLTIIQWHSLWLAKTGRRSWKGRDQTSPDSACLPT